MRRLNPPFAALLLCAALAVPVSARGKRELPSKYEKSPYALMSLTVGHPNDGWQLRAKRLRNTPHLRVRSRSRNLNYGHPALVLMLRRSAKDISSAAPGSVMLVGDLSAKRGGRLPGHRSHQSGRDADIGFYVLDKRGKPARSDRFVAFDGEGRAKDGSGLQFDDARNWLLVQSWARDRRAGLTHIFVSHPLRKRLIRYARKHERFHRYIDDATALLKQPEQGEPHDDHFHVRIACPKSQSDICKNESR